MIIREVKNMEDVLVTGVTLNKNESKITVCDVPDKPWHSRQDFYPAFRGRY